METDKETTLIVNGREVNVPPGPIKAGDILGLVGMPDGMVMRVDGGHARHFAPGEAVDIDSAPRMEFRTFRDGPVRQLRVDGKLWEWGGPAITEDEVRTIAGVELDHALHLDGSTEPVRRGSVIDLTGGWPPQVELRLVQALAAQQDGMVPVTINGRSLTLEQSAVSFEDLVRLAFPGTDAASPSSRALTVTYRHGPPARPEGSLVSRETIEVKRGEIFNVTATDKS